MAVVLVGDDVILAVAEGFGWNIVGAKLTGFGLDPWYGDPVRHVFIIGTDARPHQSQPDLRADSLHIVAASLPERGGAVVGIPRDTYVAVSYGGDKYSSVNVKGSTDEMVAIAEDLSGLSIEGYILTGFAGFKHLINGFGASRSISRSACRMTVPRPSWMPGSRISKGAMHPPSPATTTSPAGTSPGPTTRASSSRPAWPELR